jgi:hypothetical protein
MEFESWIFLHLLFIMVLPKKNDSQVLEAEDGITFYRS